MQDELQRLSHLDPENETFKEELVKIRWEKILEIRHAIRGLLATQGAETAYEGSRKFASFLWEDIFPQTQMFNIEIEKFLSDPEIREKLNSMASFQYTPPIQFRDVVIHLSALYAYYINIYEGPLTLAEMSLDYSFSKLMFMCGMFYEHSLDKGRRDISRTKESTRAKRARSDEKKQWVEIIYFQSSKIKADMTLNGSAIVIEGEFKRLKKPDENGNIVIPQDIVAPGIEQIKKFLKENPKIMREFTKSGRRYIKM